MKIEKLNKDNIKEFIRDIDTAEEIELNINKLEYYARKNIENMCQKNSVVFNKACITDLKYMTDNNGNAVKPVKLFIL